MVGAANVVALYLFRSIAPQSPALQAFAAGVALHLVAEYTGVNRAYCSRRRDVWKRQHAASKTEYNSKRKCQLLDTSSSSEVSLLLS